MKRGRTPQSTVQRRRRPAAGALAGDGDAGHPDPRRPVRGVELATIKRRISTELEDIAAQLRRQDGPVVAEHTRGDFFDAAQVVEHREREHLNTGRLAHRARRLAAALERVRAGAYGICAECGEAIPGARLMAIPDADACVRCQAQLEHARAASDASAAGVQSAWKLGRRRVREASPR